MAFTNTTQVSRYNGNGVTTAFPTGFYFLDNAHIVVTLTDSSGVDHSKTILTDFTITGALSSTGGTVTMLVSPATGETLTIARVVPMTQETDYVSGDAFPEETHERALDKAMMAASQINNEVDRAFRVRMSDGSLAELTLINNAVIGTNASGAAVMLTGAQVQTLLNLPGTVIDQPTKTFADAAARAAATPDFLGQVGVQLDTATIYIASSISAGGWSVYDFTVAADSVATVNIQAAAITTAKIADANVTAAKIAADAVTTAKILDANVTTAKLADSSVTAAKVAAGAVVQVLQDVENDVVGVTAQIPLDNTIPVSTEGYEILSQAITPASATDKVLVRAKVRFGSNSDINVCVAVFRGSTCIAADAGRSANQGSIYIEFLDSPATASAVTYSVRFGNADGASLVGVNAQPSSAISRVFGGVSQSTLTLMEIKA